MVCSIIWLWAPPDSGGDIDWLLDGPWGALAAILIVAIGVMVASKMLMRGQVQGRGKWRKPDFDLNLSKLEELPVCSIGEAKAGPVHLVGTLRLGDGALGSGEHAQVFQNRARASHTTAIAAELVLLEDESGVLGLTNLDQARVIAPREEQLKAEIIGLYLGDRVEVVGEMMNFDQPQTAGGRELRGMLGTLGQIQVRVVERPLHRIAAADSTPEPEPNPPSP